MMQGIRYGRWSDNVAPLATSITAIPADPAYPATWIADRDPARPSKLADISGTTGQFDFVFGSAQRVDAVALIHHNLAAGLRVDVHGSANNYTTIPLVASLVVPSYRLDGFCVSPWLDLRQTSGYTQSGYTYWRIVFPPTTPAPAIGEIVLLSHLRTLDRNPQWNFVDSENHPLIEHATDYGVVTTYEYGTLTRTYTGTIVASDVGAVELRDLARDARFRSRGWLFIPDAGVNDAWLVRFLAMPQLRQHQVTNANPMTFSVEEISRGLQL